MSFFKDIFDRTNSISNPSSADYDPRSPLYVVTADSSSTYYVGPVAPVTQSADDLKAEIASQYDSATTGADAWYHKFLSDIGRQTVIDQRFTSSATSAAGGLAQGLTTRQNGTAPQTAWDTTTHEHMNAVVNSTADPDTVSQSAQGWIDAGNQLGGHQSTIAAAINDSVEGWQGDGGDAARTQMAQIAKWMGVSAQGSALAGRQQDVHAQVLGETKKQMAANPPVAFDAAQANVKLQQITDPVQYGQQFKADMDQYNQQKAAQQQAARTMTQFDQSVGGASTTAEFPTPPPATSTPTGGPPGGPGAPVGGPKPPVSGGGPKKKVGGEAKGPVNGSGGNGNVDPTGGQPPAHVGGPPSASGGDSSGQPGTHQPGGSGDDGTHSAGAPEFGSPSGGLGGASSGSVGNGPVGGPGSNLGGPGSAGGSWVGGPGARADVAFGGGNRVGDTGGVEGFGAKGGPGGSGLEPGGRSGGSPSRPGVVEEPVGRGGAGTSAGGKTSSSTGPLGRGERRDKEEDEEHTRPSYLLDNETPTIFESEEKTAPPVIGLWDKNGRPAK